MNLREYLKDNFILLDGGMGTSLIEAGLQPGELPERWNISHPDIITSLHKAYYDAGSNIVLANTFGASTLKFDLEELENIIYSAIKNVKNAIEQSNTTQPKFVALDVGPLGRLLKPYGDLDFDEAVSIFATTVKLGAKAGADLVFIETMTDSYETKAALLATKENCDLPVFVSNAYGSDGKLMTGADPASMVAMLEGMHADAIGANCSLGPEQLVGVMQEYLKYASVPVLLKPNAGLPRTEGGKTVYDVMPPEFAGVVRDLMQKGLRIVGGCCGTTPAYIAALNEAKEGLTPLPIEPKHHSLISSYTHAVEFGPKPVLIGERINPTGKKRFQAALRENDMNYIIAEGLKQADAGVGVLDVNVGLPEIDEPTMLVNTVKELQAVSDLPLQLDTSDPMAMEAALRIYNGKAMVNSVNGKKEVMDAVFPLVAKYGGLVVCLTLDEDGIPDNADRRIEIANNIIAVAKSYGIDKKDLIFDPLAMTISADTTAALATLESVKRLHEMGCNTSLGVSNVSFGLPQRNLVTSTFFACNLQLGLSAAIMNPYAAEMMSVYYAYNALHNLDESCMEYIGYATNLPTVATTTATPQPTSQSSTQTGDTPLQNAIIRGLKSEAASLTREMLKDTEPLAIVQNEVIPALDKVGIDFEAKKIFLPQLLMAAEASKNAFEEIKNQLAKDPSQNQEKRCKVVIATVHGDIHDIGKNIVKLLLENYSFDVIDLGKDVPAEVVVDKVVEVHAPLVGLSALMTTTVPAMQETIELLRERAPWAKACVGGAVLTQEYADKIGADKYCRDAMETVRYAETIDNQV